MIARLCLMLALFPTLVTAQVYKWRDAEGNMVYSQTAPPAETPSETITPAPAPSEASDAARKQLDALQKRLDDQRKRRNEAAKKAKQEEKKQAALRENCARARASLAELEYKTNPLVSDGQGGFRRMTVEEHDAKVRELRQNLGKYCR